MYTKQKLVSSAILLACGTFSSQTQAALPVDAVLNFTSSDMACFPIPTAGTYPACSSSAVAAPLNTGTYFSMDSNGSGTVGNNERVQMYAGEGLRLTISGYPNVTQDSSGSHSGPPNGTETPTVDGAWNFFGNTGMHQTTSPVTVVSNDNAGNVVVEFAGWGVTWNSISNIAMGGCSATGLANCIGGVDNDNGTTATLTCYSDAGRTVVADCSIGSYFKLNHAAHVPLDDPSFGGVPYTLQLVGQIGGFNTPPVTSNYTYQVSSATAVPAPTGPVNINLAVPAAVTDTTNTTTNISPLSAGSLAITNESGNIATNCTPTSVSNNGDGTVAFPVCPNGTYTFDFTFADSYETSTPVRTVTVTASGDPIPNANDDPDSTANGTTSVDIDVLANDADNNIDVTSVIATDGTHGTTSVNGTTGVVTYTANIGFAGTDTFTYTVEDLSNQLSNTGTVTISVSAYNAPASSANFDVGTIATAAGSATGIVTMTQIGIADTGTFPEEDIAQSCIGGCFDFVLSGVTPGGTASIVLPLSTAIPAKANAGNTITYRKLINGSWRNFVTSVDDTSIVDNMKSAPGTVNGSDVSCPPASSTDYAGIQYGANHRCLLLTITDDGPNDSDTTDGTIADPGGIAEITIASGTDGCSMTGNNNRAADHADWLLLAGFMTMLGWLGIRRKA